jgi:hypothetical protein
MAVIVIIKKIVTHPVFIAAVTAAVRELTKVLVEKNRRR